jgi:glycosyltransferase involved in cell wall biosynthesis
MRTLNAKIHRHIGEPCVKILFVSPAYAPAWQYGGVVVSWCRILAEMAAQGDDVTVYTTDAGLQKNDEGIRNGFRLMDGVKVHYFECDSESPILSRALTRATRETISEFDLMHLAGVWQPSSVGVRRATVAAGCPYVISLHGALDEWPRRQKRFKKLAYYWLAERRNIRLASAIRVTSQMELEWSQKFAGPGQRMHVIPNGIDLQSWSRDEEGGKDWRERVGIPPDTFLFLNVGRLHRKKGLELAIEALVPLRTRKWHMAFVGDDDDGTGSSLRKLVGDLRIAQQISFHPTVPMSKLRAIYSAADLFLLPSHHENFGNVVLEALVCNCPVLMSDQVAICRDLAGISGAAVRKRDVSEWTVALEGALDRREEFKASIRNRSELDRRFSVRNSARKMMEFHRMYMREIADVSQMVKGTA